MKIRTDFVTNSSSSSFILSFNNKEEAIKIIKDKINKFPARKEHYSILLSDVKNSEALTPEEIERKIVSESEMWAYYNVRFNNKYVESWICKHPDKNRWDFFQSDEYKHLCQEVAVKYADELRNRIKKNSFTVKLNYSDNDGCVFSELEHSIVPNFENTIASFNHH